MGGDRINCCVKFGRVSDFGNVQKTSCCQPVFVSNLRDVVSSTSHPLFQRTLRNFSRSDRVDTMLHHQLLLIKCQNRLFCFAAFFEIEPTIYLEFVLLSSSTVVCPTQNPQSSHNGRLHLCNLRCFLPPLFCVSVASVRRGGRS